MSQPEFETHISELREDSKPGDGLIELKHEENQVTQVNTRFYPNVLRYSLDRIFFLFTQRLSHSLSLKIIRSEHWKICFLLDLHYFIDILLLKTSFF